MANKRVLVVTQHFWPENFRITVFGLIRRVGRKIGTAFRNTATALRFNRREICRQRGGLRL